jgi:hypothetical protein
MQLTIGKILQTPGINLWMTMTDMQCSRVQYIIGSNQSTYVQIHITFCPAEIPSQYNIKSYLPGTTKEFWARIHFALRITLCCFATCLSSRTRVCGWYALYTQNKSYWCITVESPPLRHACVQQYWKAQRSHKRALFWYGPYRPDHWLNTHPLHYVFTHFSWSMCCE